MRSRKVKDVISVLLSKGFAKYSGKDHHNYYYLIIDGKKQSIFTYFSHSKKEYDGSLMGKIKNQLKFIDSKIAEDFFDCPLTFEMYVKMLKDNKVIK
jgi:hypothetical protein